MLRLTVKFQPQALHPNDFSPGLKMPKAKTNHGKSKKIRCLWCRKKFCSETNVLQHMNQPMGLCYAAGWYKDHTLRTLYQPPQDIPDSSCHPDLDLHVQMDIDVDHYDSLHPPSDQWSQGFNNDMGDIGMEVEDISDTQQSFTSIHPGCSTSFPGGSIMSTIDSLLSLNIKVWTSAAHVCHTYEDWLSGDCASAIQDKLPEGGTVLGVILSLDKMNISVMSGN
ncbi:hypothetical protein F5141DRAFT_1060284 [Pisolithus sp. B1]|nr:hypothetical protein F5141DRAFT_1060284 [Pisolithus sp. B1]